MVELICELAYTLLNPSYAAIWVAVYDEGILATTKDWLIINVPDLRQIEYYLYMVLIYTTIYGCTML